MQHYFGTILDNKAIIDGKQIHHLLNVRRTRVGEKLEVSDDAVSYLCEVKSLDPLDIVVLHPLENKRELDIDLFLAFGVLKGDHNDLIVLKGTELGVSVFLPFTSGRTVVKPTSKDNKYQRLCKKAEEGALQCRRDLIPEVWDYMTLQHVLKINADLKLFAYEEEAGKGKTLMDATKDIAKGNRVLVVIGPEGGFSAHEAALAKEAGFVPVSLGKRILRAETAALYCASVIAGATE